jgi:large subunit ribosomal protein L19
LRDRTGKSARIAEKIKKNIGIDIETKVQEVTEENVLPVGDEKPTETPKEEAKKKETKAETPKKEDKKEATVEANKEQKTKKNLEQKK